MLDSQASVIDKQERPEVRQAVHLHHRGPQSCRMPITRPSSQVLQMLGNTENKRVLELGAGIGRFTAPLAASSKSITAVDFMDNLIQENAKHNAHHGNATFLASDVMELAFAPGSFDIVFSNWLLMYLGDAEIAQLANRALEWVRRILPSQRFQNNLHNSISHSLTRAACSSSGSHASVSLGTSSGAPTRRTTATRATTFASLTAPREHSTTAVWNTLS